MYTSVWLMGLGNAGKPISGVLKLLRAEEKPTSGTLALPRHRTRPGPLAALLNGVPIINHDDYRLEHLLVFLLCYTTHLVQEEGGEEEKKWK